MAAPQIAVLVLAGASLYAGLKLVVRNIRSILEASERERAEAETRPSTPPRDKGALEWDESAGVYRPVRRA